MKNSTSIFSILILMATLAFSNDISAQANGLPCACGKKPLATEKTFAMIKPEAVKAGKSGDIIRYIELNGFTIQDMTKKNFGKQDAEQFYKEHKGKPFFNDLVTYVTSGPVILLILEKENAVADWRKLMGPTDPKKSEVGTIRKMFGTSMQENAVHGSANPEDAKNELAFFSTQKTNVA